ncbi:MAG: putative quinol monooxygenase [Bacteroidales bacterium]|nr:putative quinol monooxygenase [Bacteroidales bacterium]
MKKILPVAVAAILLSACCQTTCQKEQSACNNCTTSKDSMKVLLHVPIKVKPEAVSAFIAVYEKCAEGSFKEAGCLDYTLYQSPSDSTLFFLNEAWINKGAHLEHMKTAHFDEYIKGIEGLTDGGDTRSFEEIYVCPAVNGK